MKGIEDILMFVICDSEMSIILILLIMLMEKFTLVNGNAKASRKTIRLLKLKAHAPRTMADW